MGYLILFSISRKYNPDENQPTAGWYHGFIVGLIILSMFANRLTSEMYPQGKRVSFDCKKWWIQTREQINLRLAGSFLQALLGVEINRLNRLSNQERMEKVNIVTPSLKSWTKR